MRFENVLNPEYEECAQCLPSQPAANYLNIILGIYLIHKQLLKPGIKFPIRKVKNNASVSIDLKD